MAGKKRFAAKALVWTTVLAAGGAGAYHLTAGGAWPRVLGGRGAGTSAQLLADDARELSHADLDAVASSWANDGTSRQVADDAITSSARSADVTLARAEVTAVPPPIGSRYAVSPQSSTLADVARVETSESSSTEVGEPTPALQAELSTLPAERQPSLASTGADPEAIDASADSPLARGQDPDDEEEAAGESATPSAAARTPELATEPRALELPASTSAANAATRRARNAFRDAPAAASGTATAGRAATAGGTGVAGDGAAAGGGRYTATPPTAATGLRTSDVGQGQGAESVNPFVSRPVSQPASVPAAANPAEPRDFGDALSAESNVAPSGPPTEREDRLPGDAARSTQAALGAASGGYRSGVQAQPAFQSVPNSTAPTSNPPSYGGGSAAVDGTGKPGERALEGPQKPALAIQKLAPPEIRVGTPAKFAVQVRNVGGQAAEEVVIRDEVPHGTRLVSTSPAAESDGSHLVWQLGKLSVGEERTVEMQLMPTTEGEIGSVAAVTYSTQASVKTRSTMPQLAIRMTAPSKVMIGAEQRVKIELRNPGSGDATGVMLFENVPANVRHAAGPALEFEVGTLRAGETREMELVLKAEKAGKVVNVLSARADGNLQVQQQVEFEVIAPALSVEVNGPERRYLERPATYEVTVENPGTAAAHDVQLITKLPKGMRFVRANNMGEYDAASHAVYWSLSELPEGERGTVEVVAMPIETGPQTLQVEGRAQPGLTDETQQQIIVEGLAAIMFEVRDLEDPIEVGGETGYEIRVVNQGTKAATNVRVAINLPPGMQVVSAEGETRHAVQAGNIVFEPLATLAPKADTVYRLKVQGVQAGDQRVTVEVNTDDLGQPIRREESTRVFGDE